MTHGPRTTMLSDVGSGLCSDSIGRADTSAPTSTPSIRDKTFPSRPGRPFSACGHEHAREESDSSRAWVRCLNRYGSETDGLSPVAEITKVPAAVSLVKAYAALQ